MTERLYIGTTGAILDLIFLLHLLRIVFGWGAVVGELIIPMWASWVALVISGYLALTAFFLLRK